MRRAARRPDQIDVVYCDTGVESPVLDGYVKTIFAKLNEEFRTTRLGFRTKILKAPVAERFFVKIVGRGYPPPTQSFRWCTKNLRIKPVARFIADAARGDAIVSLGTRKQESQQRTRSIEGHGGGEWQTQFEAGRRYRLFIPMIDLALEDVWDGVFMLPVPESIDPHALERLYRAATGECPMIKSPTAPPCASGRFGCWTCTVVRKDKSAKLLIESGYTSLQPYLEFRNWLATIRNDCSRRWPNRRNGVPKPGPFNLATRVEILLAIRNLEQICGHAILGDDELAEILELWQLDEREDQTINMSHAVGLALGRA
jgi:DNA sulfur modification protein DndC